MGDETVRSAGSASQDGPSGVFDKYLRSRASPYLTGLVGCILMWQGNNLVQPSWEPAAAARHYHTQMSKAKTEVALADTTLRDSARGLLMFQKDSLEAELTSLRERFPGVESEASAYGSAYNQQARYGAGMMLGGYLIFMGAFSMGMYTHMIRGGKKEDGSSHTKGIPAEPPQKLAYPAQVTPDAIDAALPQGIAKKQKPLFASQGTTPPDQPIISLENPNQLEIDFKSSAPQTPATQAIAPEGNAGAPASHPQIPKEHPYSGSVLEGMNDG